MNKRQVNHGIRSRRTLLQAVEVLKRSSLHLSAYGGKRLSPLIRTGEAKHLVAGGNQLPDGRHTDEPGRAGDEYTHELSLPFSDEDKSRSMPYSGKVVTLSYYKD
ncbi:hypothetical protein GCM10007868_29510 [Gluconobacter frateurii]|nr:hypothetical protein GCM10007868_29510 [Gluconobacter frateurii]